MLVEEAVLRGYCGRLGGCTAFSAIIDVSLPELCAMSLWRVLILDRLKAANPSADTSLSDGQREL